MEEMQFLDIGTDWGWIEDKTYFEDYGIKIEEGFRFADISGSLGDFEKQFSKVFNTELFYSNSSK